MTRPVATALYGWMERAKRDGVAWDWESLFAACAVTGVDGVETDPTPEELAILTRLGLRVSAAYVGLPLYLPFERLDLDAELLPVAERLADAGARDLILNVDQAEWSARVTRTAEHAKRTGDNLSRIADLVAPLGLRLALHNHADDAETARLDLDAVVEYADPIVGLCVDTGWALVAGHDPVDWVREHRDRVHALHLRNQHGRTPTEDLLEGDLDVPGLLAALGDFDGWLTLELWHPEPLRPERSMADDVRRSADYLRALS